MLNLVYIKFLGKLLKKKNLGKRKLMLINHVMCNEFVSVGSNEKINAGEQEH